MAKAKKAAKPRPASPSAGGGLLPWLIGAVAAWMIATVLLVILYTDQARITQESESMAAERARVINSAQQADPRIAPFFNKASASATMAQLLAEEIQALAELAVGAEDEAQANLTIAQDKTDLLLAAVRSADEIENPDAFKGINLHDALKTMFQLLRDQVKANRELSGLNKGLTDSMAEMTTQLEAAKASFEESVSQLGQTVASVETDRNQFRTAKDAEVARFETNLVETNEEKSRVERQLNNAIQDLDQRLAVKDNIIAKLKDQIEESRGTLIDPEDVATEADGQIIQAIPGDSIVYVNVGKKQNLTLGTTFGVFAAPIPGQPREEAKATIEVITVLDDTAECRISGHDPSRPILDGDLIANAVFNRNRVLRFVITGDFDLNHDGVNDPDGIDEIAALVTRWGGDVAPQLDERIDFVVLGLQPRVRTLLDEPSDEQKERHAEQSAAQTSFLAVKDEARALSIPILTQDQFFRYIGLNTQARAD